ncbi:MAG: hypothetical protein LAT67_07565 [Balneolales bacterium]|nr:hypothetical protein [Balneolales bacterium]
MIYLLFIGLLYLAFLSIRKYLRQIPEKIQKKLLLVEYAGAATIFMIMLEAAISERDGGVYWYPYAVMGVIAVIYSGRLIKYLADRRNEAGKRSSSSINS